MDTLERQRAAPQYRKRREALEARMRVAHVSDDIIARVVRLNPNLVEGQRLRGFHYKRTFEPWMQPCVSRGRAIRLYGRSAVEALPRASVFRRGRRKYITQEAVWDFLS